MEKKKYNLNIALLNGIILTLIGILVLLTPFTVSLSPGELLVDIIAGMLLTLGGGLSLIAGFINRLKRKNRDSADN